jgi:hypothetical protein
MTADLVGRILRSTNPRHVLAQGTLLAASAFLIASMMRVPDFASRGAFVDSAYAKQPDSAMNAASHAVEGSYYIWMLRGDFAYEARNCDLAGEEESEVQALRAVRQSDHRRILMGTVIEATILAGMAAWHHEGGRANALALVQQVQPGNGPDCGLYVWSRILLGIGGPAEIAEGDADLTHALGEDFLAHAAALGPRCAEGKILPDAVPPVLALVPSAGTTDGFWSGLARQDHLRLALALAEVRARQQRPDQAFALAALCLNSDPQDREARFATARFYRDLHHPEAARALLGDPALLPPGP